MVLSSLTYQTSFRPHRRFAVCRLKMDESIYANLDSLSNELNVTKLQLSSKRQAIVILTQQLEDAKKEAYQFKLMAEQVQERYKNLKQVLGSEAGSPTFGTSSQRNLFINLKVKLNESEMHSRILETELSNLRKRNAELMDDIALLKKSAGFQHSKNLELMAKEKSSFETQGRESLIKQLELKTLECQRIKRDLELCNEEKQEILSELIHWKKSDETESNEETNSIGADTVLQENKLLSRQISRLEADKKLLMQTLAKYQHGGSIQNLRTFSSTDSTEDVEVCDRRSI